MLIKKLKTIIKHNYGYILLILILAIVAFISFEPGKYLLSNDNYSPELNPSLTIERSLLSPAWRSYRVLGFASESEQADILRSGLFGFLNVFVPSNVLGQLYYLICLFLGVFFAGKLAEKISKGYKNLRKYSQTIFLLSGITYLTTLWTIWVFYQNMGPYITNYGFLPPLLYSLYLYITDSSLKNLFYVFLSSLFFTATSVIATLFVSDFILISMFVIFLVFQVKGLSKWDRVKRTFTSIGIFLLTQLFWLLPFVFYTLNSSSDIVNSFVNRTITNSVLDLESDMQSAINSARLYSRILTDSGGEDLLFSMGEDYLLYDFYKVLGLIPAIFTIIAVPFIFLKKNYKLLVFVLLAFGTWFIIKVTNPPLGFIFTWMQDTIPLFKQVFRWPFSKLGNIFLLSVSVVGAYGVIYFAKFLGSFFKRSVVSKVLMFGIVSFVVLSQLAFAEFLFTGKLFSERSLVSLPQEYYSLRDYLEEKDPKGRIYYAPPSNNSYFREYDWGFRGSQFISYIVPNPMMDLSLTIGSEYGENAIHEISNVYRSGDVQKFVELMEKYEVEYILYDENILKEGFSFSVGEEISDQILKEFDVVWSEGDLYLYQLGSDYDVPLVEKMLLSSGSMYTKKDFFVRKDTLSPTLSPLYSSWNDYEFDGDSITTRFVYDGIDGKYSLSLDYSDLLSFPTAVVLEGKKLILQPSYPRIVESEITSIPREEYQVGDNYDYYSVGDTIFSAEEIGNGAAVESLFGDVISVKGFSTGSKRTLDITNELVNAVGGDCSGIQDLQYDATVLDQGLASGIELKSDSNLPCLSSNLDIDFESDALVAVGINWESESSILPGFCLYSENRGECLNDEKYFATGSPFGDIETTIPVLVDKDDQLSLTLYAVDSQNRSVSNLVFRDVSFSYTDEYDALEQSRSTIDSLFEEISLVNGAEYSVSIPLIQGYGSYLYNGDSENSSIWQPNTRGSVYSKILFDEGLYQEVQDGFINQSNNLFSTEPHQKYMLYLNGTNYENIPGDICLVYSGSNECWYQEMLLDDSTYSFVNFFNSDSSFTNRLDVLFNSHSYNNLSVNKLEEFGIQKVTEGWDEIAYIPENRNIFSEYPMRTVGGSPHSTIYKVKATDVGFGNRLISIPQAYSSGWFAIAKTEDGIKVLDEVVKIKGWKQAWDVSSVDFEFVYVIYWPNLLGYLGYAIIIFTTIYILTKLFNQRIRTKYAKK